MRLPLRIVVACSLCALFAIVLASRPSVAIAVIALIPLALGLFVVFVCGRNRKNGTIACAREIPDTPEVSVPLPQTDALRASEQDSAKAGDSSFAIDVGPYPAALAELFSSIVRNLNSTSEPISEKLVAIRAAITSFLKSMEETRHDIEKFISKDEVKNGIDSLRAHISELSRDAERSYSTVSTGLGRLDTQMEGITDVLGNISRIAENVHVLSINASIESARAGAEGRGFKVIANEIQKLAGDTKSFVVSIESAVRDAKVSLVELTAVMKESSARAAQDSRADSTKYDEIHRNLEIELGQLLEVYAGVAEFISRLEGDMSALSPIAMLHVIVTQEIENLGKVVDDLLATISEEFRTPDEIAAKLGPSACVERIRSRLTTSRELDALAKAVGSAVPGTAANMRRSDTEIEFF
jgi:Methyl-accepting chemotaxis protein